jgi:hypothetical protein
VTLPRESLSLPPEGTEPIEPREQFSLLNATVEEAEGAEASGGAPASEGAVLSEALNGEYSLLSTMLASVWSASLFRVSLFLGVVSAVGVSLGLAAQASGGFGGTFTVFALVALPLALFLGLATFARTVELQRESIVYITGMNRIRHAVAERMPASRPYFVLSLYDDEAGIFRSQGTGIRLHPPRFHLAVALVQTQGIVAVMCSALAAAIGGLAATAVLPAFAWVVAAAVFVVMLGGLMAHWNRSLAELQSAIRPLFPTPPDERNAPI